LRIVAAISLATILTVVTGCTQTPTMAQQHSDPLHGILTPPGQPQPVNAPRPQNVSQPAGGVSALPTSYSATNNAALASSWQGPLGRPLAIDDEGRPYVPGQMGTDPRQSTPGFPPPNANPKVEPVPDSNPPPQTLAPKSDWKTPQVIAPAAQIDATLSKQLQARGVLQEKKDTVPEGVRLTCYVSRGPTGGLRALEATAADYATAAQAMLQQLDLSK
jgi:hypothetical protein